MMIRPLSLVLSVFFASAAVAQMPPGKSVQLVVPFAPGGAQDAIARYVGAKLSTRLGTPVIVENKGGAGGVIAADGVAKGVADGTLLLMATGGAISIAPHLQPALPYDPLKDLVPVALLADTPMTLAVRAESPYKTATDLIADAKARPASVSYASTGNGTVSNLTGELFGMNVGAKLLHVPYRGAGPAMTDLLSGQVAAMVTSAASIEPMVASGKARVLATFTAAPIAALKAPTVREATAVTGLEVPVWVGIMAPAKTPAATIEALAAALVAICGEADTKERMEKLGALSTCGGAAQAGEVIRSDHARWKTVIASGTIKAE